jgi:hypothetical protein
MGEFSSMCKECDKAVQGGDRAVLFLLDKGEVVEMMRGKYDNYGRIYIEEGKHKLYRKYDPEDKLGPKQEGDSFKWQYKPWGELCNMEFGDSWIDSYGYIHSGSFTSSGFAYYHEACYHKQIPQTTSRLDPNQGWGIYKEEKYFPDHDQICDFLLRKLQWMEIEIDENHLESLPESIYQLRDNINLLKEHYLYISKYEVEPIKNHSIKELPKHYHQR